MFVFVISVPTAAQHIIAKNSLKSGQSEQPLGIWAQGLDPEDINLLHRKLLCLLEMIMLIGTSSN